MANKVALTDRKLANLAPAKPGQRYEIGDAHVPGFRVRVGDAEGAGGKAASVTFIFYGRFPPSNNPSRRTIGEYPVIGLAEARERAWEWRRQIAAGFDPKAEAEKARAKAALDSAQFNAIADTFMDRHVNRLGLRTAKEIAAMIDAVRPVLGPLNIAAIRRRDIVALMDRIEDERGPRAADKTLGTLSKLFNWWAARDDEFANPIVRGMRRVAAKDRARARILADDEIAALWRATAAMGSFGACCRLLLLTGQRRAKVAAMRWQDLDGATWNIPAERREKANALQLRLPPMAMAVIDGQPRIARNPYVFAGRVTGTHLNGFSKAKAALDAAMAAELGRHAPGWVLHDLRRTAKSLMARAGVRPDISERVLGHAIAGVEGVYDRHHYADEKADALLRLAALVERIVNPVANVMALERARG